MNKEDLVLVGGGHTHVLAILMLAMRPISSVRITLISESILTPYSGMLPGYIAGHYSLQQTNIDLNQLCRKAGVRWINARVSSVDARAKNIALAGQAAISFDKLSIDIGSTPDLSVKGAREFALGVKPIAKFQNHWHTLLKGTKSDDKPNVKGTWGVIGAGAGGVELVLAMAHRMRQHSELKFKLIFRGKRVLPGYPKRVVDAAEKALKSYGIELQANFLVAEVFSDGVINQLNEKLTLSQSIWCTGATGASWLIDSGLDLSKRFFIQVNEYLQSTSHADIFAAGDIAEMSDDPRPKAGVYAVRQAPQLVENIRRAFAGQALRKIELQNQFLSLLSLGQKQAVASRNGLVLTGAWVWHWKDRIDQKFMAQFAEMEIMDMVSPTIDEDQIMHCGGCGSKLGPDLLMQNLKQIDEITHNENALLSAEDASVWSPTPGTMSVQSIDGFRSFTSNEYLFGKICCAHALSDVYAMGAQPRHLQAWINLQHSGSKIQQRDHLRMLQGVVDGAREQGASLNGGHSSEGIETHLAVVANGEVTTNQQWCKSGVQSGDAIVMSKAIGTGVILAADMLGQADAQMVEAAYSSMLADNARAAKQLTSFQPHAVTDVTGFGLLGHLLEMLGSSDSGEALRLSAILNLSAVPLLTGALQLSKSGVRSSLYPQIKSLLDQCCSSSEIEQIGAGQTSHNAMLDLLIDPQTSGGLLACLSENDATSLLQTDSGFVKIGHIEQLDSSFAVHVKD